MNEYRKTLDEVFYSRDFLMKSLPKFVNKLKALNFKIPYKFVKFYYDNQAITQIFRPPHYEKEKEYKPILSFRPFAMVYMDTMYVTYPNQTLAIVTLVDLFSKYGDARVIPIRAGAKNISSEKTKEALDDMLESIDKLGYDVDAVYTDNGNEFSKHFHKFLGDSDIEHVYGHPDDKRMTSPIERFNNTLRLSIEKYKMTYGRITQKSIAEIVRAYNSTSHSIGYTPLEILKDSKIRNIIKSKNIAKRKKFMNTGVISGYCRILLTKDLFAKTGANWSKEIYRITRYNPNNNRYYLEGIKGAFNRDELQPINRGNLMGQDRI